MAEGIWKCAAEQSASGAKVNEVSYALDAMEDAGECIDDVLEELNEDK